MCRLKDLVKIHQKLTFANNILLELEQLNQLPFYDFGYYKTFQKQKVFKPITTGKVRDENINFQSNRTSSMLGKIQTKISVLSPRASSSHRIPNYHTITRSKLNEFINKLTLSYFSSFCQPFNFLFFQTIFDRHLFYCQENLFFNRYIKKLLKSRNDWLLNYRLLHYFPMLSKNYIR